MTQNSPLAVPDEVLEAYGWLKAEVTPFEGGLMNRHWLVTLDGQQGVLRRYHHRRTLPSIEWEQKLVERADEFEWPVPVPLISHRGTTVIQSGGALWSGVRFLSGEPVATESSASLRIRGRLLARLHKDLARFKIPGQRPGAARSWELDAWVEAANAGSFNDLVRKFGLEYPQIAALIRQQRYRSLRELARLKYPDLPDFPIHGDFHGGNLLWTDGRLSGLLDFDQSRRDAQVCDLAIQLVPFLPLEERQAGALLEGYNSLRPLEEAEWDLLTPLVRAWLLVWVSYLLVEWRVDQGPAGGIIRTMSVRFPAFEAVESTFRDLRRQCV